MKYLQIYVLIALLFCAKGFGQGNYINFSELDSKKIEELKIGFKDYDKALIEIDFHWHLTNALNVNRKKISNKIFKDINLKLSDLKVSNISLGNLDLNHQYLLGNDTIVLIDNLVKKDISVFIITNNNKKMFFVKDKGFFLTINKNTLYAKVQATLSDEEFNNHDCITTAVKGNVLDNNLKAIKSIVIFNNEDTTTSNSAFAVTNNSNDTKINLGFNFNYREKHFLNVNLNTSAENSGYFYSKRSWSNEVGANFSYNYIGNNNSQYFGDIDCKTLKKKRGRYIKNIVERYKDLNLKNSNNLKKIDSLKANNLKIKQESQTTEISDEYVKNKKNITQLENDVSTFDSIINNPKKYMESKITTFDSTNDILKGYNLKWFSFTGGIENQSIKIDSTNILTTQNEVKNIPSIKLGIAYNWNIKKRKKKNYLKKQIFIAQVNANANMSSFLETIQKDRTPLLQNVDNEIYVYDSEGEQLGRYQDLKRAFWTGNVGVNMTGFCFSETIGITSIFKHNFAIQDLDYVTYKNNYTAQLGLVFRAQGEKDINKATFRILAGAEDLLYNQKTFKEASVKISVAIPFNIFTK